MSYIGKNCDFLHMHSIVAGGVTYEQNDIHTYNSILYVYPKHQNVENGEFDQLISLTAQ